MTTSTSTTTTPRTLPEWRAYVATLGDQELFAAAAGANTMRFVQTLQEEEYKPAEIHMIMYLFAKRFQELDVRPPMDGLYDLIDMAKSEPPLSL